MKGNQLLETKQEVGANIGKKKKRKKKKINKNGKRVI
jgi:hypothetical protein